MSISLVQSFQTSTPASGATQTSDSLTVTDGNLLVVMIRGSINDFTVPTISDDFSNSYTKIGGVDISNVGQDVGWMFYSKNISGGTGTITATWPQPNTTYKALIIHEYSGLDVSSPLDAFADDNNPSGSNSGGSSTSSITSGSFTTADAHEVIVMFCPTDNTTQTYTAGSGYTLIETATDKIAASQHKIVSATQSGVTASMSLSSGSCHWGQLVASFIAAAGGGGGGTASGFFF